MGAGRIIEYNESVIDNANEYIEPFTKVKLSEIIPNPNNPRLIKDEKFKQLVKSIRGGDV